MKIRHEINMLNREVTGDSGNLPELISVDGGSYSGSALAYLEVVAKVSSGTGTIKLYDSTNSDFSVVDSDNPDPTQLGARGVFHDGTFLYVGFPSIGLHVYTVSAVGALTLVSVNSDIRARRIYGDGTFLYGAAEGSGILCFSVDANGETTLEDSRDDGFGGYYDFCYDVWSDGTFVFAAWDSDGIRVYSVDSNGTLTLKDRDSQTTNEYYRCIWGQNGYVFVACKHNTAGGIRVYSVDGSGNLTHEGLYYEGYQVFSVWGDGTYIYVGTVSEGGIFSYSVDAAGVMTLIDNGVAGTTTYWDVWGDSSYIYVSGYTEGFHRFTVDSSGNFTYVDTTAPSSAYLYGIGGDGTFVFCAWYRDGLRVFGSPPNIAVTTTSYTRYRSNATPVPAVDFHLNLSTTALSIVAARLVIIQDTDSLTGSECQFEIGTYAYDMWTDGVTQSLVSPKYWYYDSSKWDGTIAIYGEVVWVSLEDKDAVSIYIQQDDGSFGNWTTVSTLVSDGGNEVISITRGTDFSASLTSGRNYRLAVNSLGSKAGKGVTVYLAKIIVVQTTATLITKMEEHFLLANSEQTSTGLKLFNSLYDATEFDSVTVDIYPEHDADNAGANTKLQEGVDGTPSDVASSSITGNNRTRGTTALSITDGEEISTNIVAVS